MQITLIHKCQLFNLTVLLYKIMLLRYAEKTGLRNVMQGSYKFQVRSPAGSHLSKLVATDGRM